MSSNEGQKSIEEMTKDYDRVCPRLIDLVLALKKMGGRDNNLIAEILEKHVKLVKVITQVQKARADDTCWMDIDLIFKACGLPVPDRKVGDKVAMLKNCDRFVNTMCSGGAWKSYVELEAELAAAKIENARLKEEKEDLRDRYYKKVYELETYQAINPGT
jgi:hypothetical protein